ncbi:MULTISPECIES: glycosyltransferase family 4 protein [Amycolatopsis]|uniref:Glycosyltransferase family 4 protein n=1 Tax=Amycolatopsis dendrobii TaxID=2760662 RepID=A0A7W3W3F5_9PSEU|nr:MULTISPECIES: glycosyltransferase family 4 protein [Amycolatopsis]MBB1158014.1 glycosyltransferase family 4 protein [Amycolatopsis dendrobii]UKD57189.1 glycosyltransferase family 4 protein [Amycolatopsis sp. FU40]
MSRERTVVFATPYFPPDVGGVQTYVHSLAAALREVPGWRPVVVTTSARAGSGDPFPVYRLPALAKLSNTPLDPRWPRRIRRILRAEQADFLNVHTPVPGLADAATLAAGNTPVVVTYHAAALAKDGHPFFNAVARAYAGAEAFMLRRADLILGVSDYVADRFRPRYGDKVGVLENAVAPELLTSPLGGNRPYAAAFLARLEPTHAWKGLDQLLHAMSIRRGRLLVIGDGAARPGYEALARKLGIDGNVTFAGNLRGSAKFRALRSASSLVLCPTSPNDAFPTALLEAWASRVPVIATAVGPLAALVTDGVNGLLAAPRSPEALAGELDRLESNPGLAHAIRENACELVRSRYTWSHRVAEFVEQLTALDRRGAPVSR